MGGKVARGAAQAVGEPRTQDGKPVEPKTAVFLERCRRVVGGLGDHRLDDRQFVGDSGKVREQLGDPQPAVAALAKRPVTLAKQANLAEKHVGFFVAFEWRAMKPCELGLVVEAVNLAEAAGGDNVDHSAGTRSGVRGCAGAGHGIVVGQHRHQGRAANTGLGKFKKPSPGNGGPRTGVSRHRETRSS